MCEFHRKKRNIGLQVKSNLEMEYDLLVYRERGAFLVARFC